MAHAADGLVVDSVTGVDVSLEVAGTGARSLAFLIDLLIRTILVTAWYVVATLVYNGKFMQTPDDPDGTWYLYVATPATLHLSALSHGARDRDARANAGEAHGGHSDRDA